MKPLLVVIFFFFFAVKSYAVTFVDGRSTSVIFYESNNFKNSFDRDTNRRSIFYSKHGNFIVEGFVLTGAWRDRLKNYSEIIVQDKDKVLRAVFFDRNELSTILNKCLPESIVNNYFDLAEQE